MTEAGSGQEVLEWRGVASGFKWNSQETLLTKWHWDRRNLRSLTHKIYPYESCPSVD